MTPAGDGSNPGPGDAPCVAVIGMGRSGTSATAGLLVNLGLTGPVPGDLVPATETNEQGHWESLRVIRTNMRLLRAVGGFGHGPPPITLEWQGVDGYAERKAEAQEWFRASSSGKPMMVKDPRMCLTLTFWRDALPAPMAAVFVLRDPLKVARSLEARDRLPMSLGLALWDRHVRSASLGLEGLPTLVVGYDEMLEHAAEGTAKVVEFLGTLGIGVSSEDEQAASKWFNPSLRHQSGTTDDYAQAADVQREVFQSLVARAGIHEAWESPSDLPEPQLWVDDAIRLRRQFQVKRLELKKIQGTRTFRVARSLKRIAKPAH